MLGRLAACTLMILSLSSPAAANEGDAGFLTRLLQDSLTDAGREVRVIGFQGALSSRATIRELTIADDEGVWLTLRGAVLDWNRSALLLRRQLEVNELSADEIIIERTPDTGPDRPSPEARSFALPELPISLRVDRLRSERVELGEALFGEQAEVRLDGSARLAGGEGFASFEIERIDGAGGQLRMDGSYSNTTRVLALDLAVSEPEDGIAVNLLGIPGNPSLDLSIAGEGPLDDFLADIRLATDGEERLAGEVQLLSEPPEEEELRGAQRFRADLAGDIAPLFAPEYRDFFGNRISLNTEGARLPDGRMELSALDLQAEAISLSGEARLDADGMPKLIALEGRIAAPDGEPVLLPLPGPRTKIGEASLTLDFDAERGEDWRAEISTTQVARPDMEIDRLWLSGEGRITDTFDDVGVAAQFSFAAEGLAPADPDIAQALGRNVNGRAQIDWQQGEPVRLPTFVLSGRDYSMSGTARLEGQKLSGRFAARLEDLERLSGLAGRPLSGRMVASVEGEAELLSGAFDLDAQIAGRNLALDQPELDRLLAGSSRIRAIARRDETGTTIDRLDVTAQQLEARLTGTLTSTASSIAGTLNFADLTVLGNGYGGALAAEGRLEDRDGVQYLSFTATGQDLSVGQSELDGLFAGESLLALEASHSDGTVDVEQFTFNASTLSASVTGQLAQGASDLSLDLDFSDLSALGPNFGGRLEGSAGFREDGTRREVTVAATGTNLALGIPEVDRILRGESRLSLDGHQDGERFRVDDFAFASPLLTADANATVEGERRLLELSARLSDLGVLVPELAGPVTLGGRITEASGEEYQLDLSGTGPGGLDAQVTGRLTQDLIASLSLTGSTNLAISNRFIQPINIQGPADFDLRVDGPLGLDALSGTLTARGARVVSPQLGVTIEDVAGTATFGGGQIGLDMGAAVQGGGRLQLGGSVGLDMGRLPADLRVTLQEVRITDRRIYETDLSGELAVTGGLRDSTGRISGELSLANTEIRIPSTGLGAGEYIPQMRHINDSAATRRTRRDARLNAGDARANGRNVFDLDLTLSSPNQVFIRGRGLDAELGGSLRLGGTTADVVPAGEFTLLRGRLDILGRRFSLSDGVARMQGRFIPFVRLTATTSTDGITASIILEGEADALAIRFVSSPELPEEEVVARLLFGRDLGQLTPFQAAQLASAVATLAGRGGEGLVGNLRQSFGLDDLDVSTGTDGTAALRLGRYISDNVYTDVTVDSEGRSEVSINLDIGRSVTVRGRTDTEGRSGIGIFFERDY